MDSDAEVLFNYPSLFRVYNSGSIERFTGTTDIVPASVDPATGVASKDVTIDSESGVSARLYLPNAKKKQKHDDDDKLPILMYFHGGAFCVYSASSPQYHSFLNSLASQAHLLAVSVSYRLATEHLLPAAYKDSWAATKWVLDSNSDEWLAEHGDFARVFIAGDSAGGNITHQVALRAGEEGVRIEGMALVHPFFWGREAAATTETRKTEFIAKLWRVVNLAGADDVDGPWINPIGRDAPSLPGLGCRKAMVCVASEDVLTERGTAYCEALKGSGWGDGEVELVEFKGEGHCFHLHKPQCDEALKLMARLVAFFSSTISME